MKENKTGLVLEGGGMRGVFTAGVLDAFMARDITFDYCVGVSAGACTALSYQSRQPERARKSNIDLLDRHPFFSLRNLWKQHSLYDLDLMYRRLPNELLPFDYDTCFASPMRLEMVTTNCLTGEAHYLSEGASPERLLDICKASSSLPYICPMVPIDGVPMLDGGIVDSIPVARALEQRCGRVVVVLTRPKGYRKAPSKIPLSRLFYRHHPALHAALQRRVEAYNAQLDLVERLEAEERITVLRPSDRIHIRRLEKDTAKLRTFYDEGYAVGAAFRQEV